MAALSSHEKITTNFGSRTDIGLVRKHNEDSLIVSPPLFAVADGMGGHAAGEVASEIAVDTLVKYAPSNVDAEGLADAVEKANLEVIKASVDGRGREGMGTTLTAALLEGERLLVAQVGDSRAYLLHNGKLQQITRDHSLMTDMIEAGQISPEEARIHPNRSVITRALGSDPAMLADLYEINVESGDRLLLCSDGLSSLIEDCEIEDILLRIEDVQRCASTLVNEAISAGGYDNVTVIVVDAEGFRAVKEKRSKRRIKAWAIALVFAFLLIIAGAGFAFSYYMDNSAFLIEEEGKVAVYKGVPGSIFGLQASQLEEVTEVKTQDLAPGVANRLQEGIQVSGLDEAYSLVDEYKKEAEKKAVAKK